MPLGKLVNGFLVATVMLGLLESGVTLAGDTKRAAAAQDVGLTAKNLQVLSKDTTYAELVLLMTRYSTELGVQCVFCHTQDSATEQVDFASDEAPAKLTARIMIGMVRDINGKYLSQVSDRRYAVPISCGNCHQGQTFPPAYEPKG
jgi:nitrate reductase cytochrome c-type subunit